MSNLMQNQDEGKPLADLLRSRRAELGLSLRDVEARADITKSHIHKLEMGDVANPTVDTILALSAALQLPAVRIFRCAARLGS